MAAYMSALDADIFAYTPWAIKKWHFTFVNVFADYWPIITNFLLAHSADNLQ